jgi:hypothetical protein
MLALWVTVSAAINWRGGWTVGPRYLGAAPPFFAYGALCAFEAVAGDSRERRAVIRGIAGGAAIASIVTIGLVGMYLNTVPEEMTRPLLELLLPMSTAGFVPHHALEWFGVKSGVFWYVAAACAVGAGALAAFAPWHERGWTWPLRAGIAIVVLVFALRPAFSTPEVADGRGDMGAHARRSFVDMWRPQGRDRLPALRDEAETYGDRRPCNWERLAAAERLVNMPVEAMRDEQKGGPDAPACHSLEIRAETALFKKLTPSAQP